MDAKHAKHLRATEVVEALWSEQESRDATYRIASASMKDSRDDVFQIANVLPQKELSESLQPDEAHQIANALSQMESSEFLGPDEVFQSANVLPQKESSVFLELELSQIEFRQTKRPVVKHLRELTTAVEFHQTKAGAEFLNHQWTRPIPPLVTE